MVGKVIEPEIPGRPQENITLLPKNMPQSKVVDEGKLWKDIREKEIDYRIKKLVHKRLKKEEVIVETQKLADIDKSISELRLQKLFKEELDRKTPASTSPSSSSDSLVDVQQIVNINLEICRRDEAVPRVPIDQTYVVNIKEGSEGIIMPLLVDTSSAPPFDFSQTFMVGAPVIDPNGELQYTKEGYVVIAPLTTDRQAAVIVDAYDVALSKTRLVASDITAPQAREFIVFTPVTYSDGTLVTEDQNHVALPMLHRDDQTRVVISEQVIESSMVRQQLESAPVEEGKSSLSVPSAEKTRERRSSGDDKQSVELPSGKDVVSPQVMTSVKKDEHKDGDAPVERRLLYDQPSVGLPDGKDVVSPQVEAPEDGYDDEFSSSRKPLLGTPSKDKQENALNTPERLLGSSSRRKTPVTEQHVASSQVEVSQVEEDKSSLGVPSAEKTPEKTPLRKSQHVALSTLTRLSTGKLERSPLRSEATSNPSLNSKQTRRLESLLPYDEEHVVEAIPLDLSQADSSEGKPVELSLNGVPTPEIRGDVTVTSDEGGQALSIDDELSDKQALTPLYLPRLNRKEMRMWKREQREQRVEQKRRDMKSKRSRDAKYRRDETSPEVYSSLRATTLNNESLEGTSYREGGYTHAITPDDRLSSEPVDTLYEHGAETKVTVVVLPESPVKRANLGQIILSSPSVSSRDVDSSSVAESPLKDAVLGQIILSSPSVFSRDVDSLMAPNSALKQASLDQMILSSPSPVKQADIGQMETMSMDALEEELARLLPVGDKQRDGSLMPTADLDAELESLK